MSRFISGELAMENRASGVILSLMARFIFLSFLIQNTHVLT